ncbi:MAG: family 16 glycosylhydrolase, partial [Flavobacteriaceae bacterium]|nr:family 16 glycosylhydrolase [Flavobacteriaceae bacterium]
PSSYGNTVNKGGTTIPTASSEFHIYTMEWDEDRIVFAVDGVVHYTYNPAVQNPDTWPFDANQYILLNVAILPNIDPAFSESTLEIDYVRVYREGVLGADGPEANVRASLVNPVGEYLEMEFAESAIGSELYVYDLSGRLVAYFEINQASLVKDSSHWSSGLYMAHLVGEGSLKVMKIVKE